MNKLLMIFFVFISSPNIALADTGVVGTSAGLNSIISLLINIALAVGMAVFVHGLISFYKRGEQPQQYPMGYCVSNVIAGTLMIVSNQAYKWTVNSSSAVNWATDSSLLSSGTKLNTDTLAASSSLLGSYIPPESMATLMGFIYLAGLIGFLKGLYLVKDAGKMDSQQGSGFYKALWHIVGGVACMNIVKFSCFLAYFLGFSILCAGN